MGTRFLKYQENYILEMLAGNLEGSDTFRSALTQIKEAKTAASLDSLNMFQQKQSLYEFRELKCQCQSAAGPCSSEESPACLGYAESFLQYYYLCQRQIHFEVER